MGTPPEPPNQPGSQSPLGRKVPGNASRAQMATSSAASFDRSRRRGDSLRRGRGGPRAARSPGAEPSACGRGRGRVRGAGGNSPGRSLSGLVFFLSFFSGGGDFEPWFYFIYLFLSFSFFGGGFRALVCCFMAIPSSDSHRTPFQCLFGGGFEDDCTKGDGIPEMDLGTGPPPIFCRCGVGRAVEWVLPCWL